MIYKAPKSQKESGRIRHIQTTNTIKTKTRTSSSAVGR